jgi:hypothetical protein
VAQSQGRIVALLKLLGKLCKQVAQGQFKPISKWIADVVYGIAVSHSLMLSEIARTLDEVTDKGESRALKHVEKRLSKHLGSDRVDDDKMRSAYLDACRPLITRGDGEGIVVAVDYSDLHKPRANLADDRGMQMVVYKWDGSQKKTTPGYPMVAIEASLPGGNQLPLAWRPYSPKEPGHRSQLHEFKDDIDRIVPVVGDLAWWTADRGFDNIRYFNLLDAHKRRWITRVQISTSKKRNPSERHLFMADGRCLGAYDAALECIDRYTLKIPAGRSRRRKGRKTLKLTIGARKVRLSDMKNCPSPTGPERTLVVVWGFGNEPVVLLVSEYLRSRAELVEAVKAYGRRWTVEESIRSFKDRRGWGVALEDVRALSLRGVRRLVFLAMLIYLAVAFLRESGGQLAERVLAAVRAFGPPPADPRYRMIRGLGRILGRISRARRREWRLMGASP